MVRTKRQAKLSADRLRRLADEELMRLVAQNDPDAFQVVLERHADVAFGLACRMVVGRRALAEDVVQEAFISLWRGGARYDPSRGSVRNWTLQIVHHRAIDALRRDSALQARSVSDDGLHERLHAPEQTDVQAARRDEAQQVRGALEQLPAEQSRVIELAYFSGFTHTEISHILGLPEGTVKGRMRLGLQKLRHHLPAREALL
jgi:RNA polymerase sigma-70 factor, ECF subfamily